MPRVPPLLWLLVCAAGPGLACFSAEFEDGTVACGEAGCPAGLACGADGLCYRDPADGDLGPGGPADDPNDTPPGCVASAPRHPCVGLPYLAEPPVIDGVRECGPTLEPMSTSYWLGTTPAAPADHAAEVGLAWRPDGIYLFAVVHEPELDPARDSDPVWKGDAIELYVDDDGRFAAAPKYDSPGTRQFVVGGPERNRTARRGEVYADMQAAGVWSPDRVIAVATSDGFVVEAFAGTDQLGGPTFAAGSTIGLDLAINISRDSQQRGSDDYLGQYFLRISGSGSPWPYENVGAFCTTVLDAPD